LNELEERRDLGEGDLVRQRDGGDGDDRRRGQPAIHATWGFPSRFDQL
jgi:hypothetical protein